jgi:hypothetical protein
VEEWSEEDLYEHTRSSSHFEQPLGNMTTYCYDGGDRTCEPILLSLDLLRAGPEFADLIDAMEQLDRACSGNCWQADLTGVLGDRTISL